MLLSSPRQRIFDANTHCYRLQRTSSFRNISKPKKLLPMEQPTRSSGHDMKSFDQNDEWLAQSKAMRRGQLGNWSTSNAIWV
ncbi:hypothetical protein GW17_00033492 [Ensete ventricosum]|nr:hypothetical protein GW17_00033492 [Ensete ventricosum]RZR89796.1 hypothetical protein BHM03_00017587 [Ensete ventricosum]